ncbi:MAG: aminopeptidase [Lachnospiraceae bacterium]
MNIKMQQVCPSNVDAVVCFVRAGEQLVFHDERIQSAYLLAFEGDESVYENNTCRLLRMKTVYGFVDVIVACVEKGFKDIIVKISTSIHDLKAKNVYFDHLPEWLFKGDEESIYRDLATSLVLSSYEFEEYKAKKTQHFLEEVYIYGCDSKEIFLQEGANIAKGIMIAKDLVNEPASTLSPMELAKRTVMCGQEYGFEVEVLDEKDCERYGMGAFLSVSKASASEPQFIIMRYLGGMDGEIAKGVIGKGICYDSGGLALKQAANMVKQSTDMSGAAAVIGAMSAVAMNKVQTNIIAVVAACENLIDGKGYRNGDIVTSMSGKTIFIASTDAEGRLSMADAITYLVREEEVDSIVELSTLTGSSALFFGNVCAPVFTVDDDLYETFMHTMTYSGEKLWRMPTYEEYRKNIAYETADLYNSSTGGAGGICAGVFLDSFREETPFLHVDIAGVATGPIKPGAKAIGGTGFGVKSLYYYLKG